MQAIDHTKMVLPVLVRMLVAVLFVISLFVLLFHDEPLPEELEVSLTVTSTADEVMQVFWLVEDGVQPQLRDHGKGLAPGTHRYYFRLSDSRSLDWFRLDPATRPTELTIEEMVLGWGPDRFITLNGQDLYETLEPVQQVDRVFGPDDSSVQIVSTGIDPIMRIDIDRLIRKQEYARMATALVVPLAAGLALLLALSYLCSAGYSAYSHPTYPARVRHWAGWGVAMLLSGALLTAAVPMPLGDRQPLLHFLALSYTIGAACFSPIFWFATRPPALPSVLAAPCHRYDWLLYALPCFAVWSFYLICFWPGSMSPDSLDQWRQVLRTNFKDWHPAFHTMNIWLITRLALSPAMAAAFQILALGTAVGWVLGVLQRNGVSRAVLWITAVLVAICPVNGLMAVTLWKDLVYSVVLLVLAAYLFQIVMTGGGWLALKRNWLLLGILLALVSLYRHNGVIPAVITVAALLVFYRRCWVGIAIAALAALVLTAGIRGPLYDMLEVDRGNPMQIAFKSLKRDVFSLSFLRPGAETKGKEPEESKAATAQIPDKGVETDPPARVKVKSDLQKVQDRVYSASRLWRIKPLEGFHRRIEYVNLWEKRAGEGNDSIEIRYVSSNKVGIEEHSLFPAGRDLLYRMFNQTRYNPAFFWMWRPAVYFYLLTILFIIQSWRMRKKLWLVLLPALVNSLPIFLVVVHKSIFRYHYPLVLLGMVLIVPLLFLNDSRSGSDPDPVINTER